MKYYLCLVLVLCFFLPVSSVLACSGGSIYPLEEIANLSTFVEATIVEVDDVGQNAIFRIERYLIGTGSPYLAVVNYTNGFYAVDDRGYDKGCNYGSSSAFYEVGEHGFYGFARQSDGTFGTYRYYPSYPIEDGHVSHYIFDGNSIVELRPTVEEFENKLHEILGNRIEFIPNGYDDERNYPLLRPLYLYTESGRRYVMEVDRHIREIDLTTEPFVVSPDGAHVAYYLDDNTIAFGYCSSICHYNPDFQNVESPISAQAVAFSPNSTYVATWNESSLGLYLFDNQGQSNYGRQMNVIQFGAADFRGNLNAKNRLVAWSGDSSTLVFMDDAGIWRWHIYTMADPELLVPAANLVSTDENMVFEQIETFELSQSGRYLRYGNGYNWTLLDTINGEHFANAVVTPDESNFIYVNSTLHDSGQERSNCTLPFHQSCPFAISHEGELIEIVWRWDDRVSFYFCDEASNECESTFFVWVWDSPSHGYGNWNWGWIDDIEYGDFGDDFLFALQRDDYGLELHYDGLNREETYQPERYDLSSQLDSPIARIEWGQPIFYEEH